VRIPWGYLWKNDKEGDYSFNIMQNGAMVSGGGFKVTDEVKWLKDVAEIIPECSLLMSTADFEVFRDVVLVPTGRAYEKHHIDHPVSTHA